MAKIKTTDILGVKISKVTMKEATEVIEDFVKYGKKKRHVVTPNPEFIIHAQKDSLFRRILNNADLAVPDGVGLIAGAKMLNMGQETRDKRQGWIRKILITGYRLPTTFLHGLRIGLALIFYRKYFDVLSEPVPGVDLIYKLAERAEQKGYKIFLLGGQKDGAQKSSQKLKKLYPKIKIDHSPGVKTLEEETEGELEKNLAKVNDFEPDILLVAYGFPKQDYWIDKNLPQLNCKVAIGVGSAFDTISDQVKRAPRLLRRLGLEWLWRLFFGKTSLKRIFTATVIFPLKVFFHKLRRG